MQHHRTHDLLLIKKLLDNRDNASPFTLVLDSLEQSSTGLLREFLAGANRSKVQVTFVSSETLRKPSNVNAFIDASRLGLRGIAEAVRQQGAGSKQRNLVVFDALNILLHRDGASKELPGFLSSLIAPGTSVVAVYHLDVPVPHDVGPHSPSPLTLLKYLATTILTTHSLSHVIACKEALLRSVAEPSCGLPEVKEGVVVGLRSNDPRGTVVEMEYRRKSGRAVHQVFFLPRRSAVEESAAAVTLLDDHPEYRAIGNRGDAAAGDGGGDDADHGTFNLELTEKQRRAREGVVLPYFDAQREGGVGEGGRILYDMGVEDDFDEEEDEI